MTEVTLSDVLHQGGSVVSVVPVVSVVSFRLFRLLRWFWWFRFGCSGSFGGSGGSGGFRGSFWLFRWFRWFRFGVSGFSTCLFSPFHCSVASSLGFPVIFGCSVIPAFRFASVTRLCDVK